jgi:hypothetical protein
MCFSFYQSMNPPAKPALHKNDPRLGAMHPNEPAIIRQNPLSIQDAAAQKLAIS